MARLSCRSTSAVGCGCFNWLTMTLIYRPSHCLRVPLDRRWLPTIALVYPDGGQSRYGSTSSKKRTFSCNTQRGTKTVSLGNFDNSEETQNHACALHEPCTFLNNQNKFYQLLLAHTIIFNLSLNKFYFFSECDKIWNYSISWCYKNSSHSMRQSTVRNDMNLSESNQI